MGKLLLKAAVKHLTSSFLNAVGSLYRKGTYRTLTTKSQLVLRFLNKYQQPGLEHLMLSSFKLKPTSLVCLEQGDSCIIKQSIFLKRKCNYLF
jgi:hypothetical protein